MKIALLDPLTRILANTSLWPSLLGTRSTRLAPPPSAPTPPLNIADMQPDITRLITSVALRFTDHTCVFLHTDELEAEGRATLANVLRKGWLIRAQNRMAFFKILKTAVSNRMRSLVQQHRFTQKRTGVKPPPKDSRVYTGESTKPVEISLDNPDAHLQVGDDAYGHVEDDYDTRELVKEIRLRLKGRSLWVFNELIEPSVDTLNRALLDAHRGRADLKNMRIVVTNRHKADHLEITLEQFEESVLIIQQVTQRLRTMHPEDHNYENAVDALAKIFNCQVPKSTDAMIVRRLFTIAARDNWQHVTQDVEKLLTEVGAVSPKFNRETMNCFGVLYQRGHKLCEACGIKTPCATQAANVGLGEITLHPKLLGAKMRRTPYIVPGNTNAQPPITSSVRDMEIVDYLFSNFKRVTHCDETYFQPQEFRDTQKLLFCIGKGTVPLKLRFCNPSPVLRKQLVSEAKCYYAADDAEAETVIALINEHAKAAYA